MRLLIYEWCCSGGLSCPDAVQVVGAGDDAHALAREGRAMFESLATDAARDGGFDVLALCDEAIGARLPACVRRVAVPAGREVESLAAAAGDADAVIVVAPETAGVLASHVAAARATGGRVLAPGDAFIKLAADKQTTIDALAAAGVPVPAGRSLAAGEAWPEPFVRPAVRKARASAGCDGLVVVRAGDPAPGPAPGAARIEAWYAGTPVGVSCLVGPRGVVPLAALRQCFASGSPASYVGGEPLDDAGARGRAERLAVRAVKALLRHDRDRPAGWIGVDMILGPRGDGLDDRVLEVNPRVTTSFVGLTTATPVSLVRAMLDVAEGRDPDCGSLCHGCTFTITDTNPRQLP